MIRHSPHDFSAVARCLPGLLLLSDFLESNSYNTHENKQINYNRAALHTTLPMLIANSTIFQIDDQDQKYAVQKFGTPVDFYRIDRAKYVPD